MRLRAPGRKRRQFAWLAVSASFVLILVLPCRAPAQRVSLSSALITECSESSTVTVSVDDASGALAFDLRIGFRSDILSIPAPPFGECGNESGVGLGELLADCALCAVAVADDSIAVSVGCTRPRSGGGALLHIDFDAHTSSGLSVLTFSECQVDERPCAATQTGSVRVECRQAPTPTRTIPGCPGDCDGDDQVTVDEILLLVSAALGSPGNSCDAGDSNRDGVITVDEILSAVTRALRGCSAAAL